MSCVVLKPSLLLPKTLQKRCYKKKMLPQISQVKSFCVILWTEFVPQEMGHFVEIWEWSQTWSQTNRITFCLAVFSESLIGIQLKKPPPTAKRPPLTKKVQHPLIHLCLEEFSLGVLPIPLRFTLEFSEFGNGVTSLILARSPSHLILCYLHLPTWFKSLCNTFHRHLL